MNDPIAAQLLGLVKSLVSLIQSRAHRDSTTHYWDGSDAAARCDIDEDYFTCIGRNRDIGLGQDREKLTGESGGVFCVGPGEDYHKFFAAEASDALSIIPDGDHVTWPMTKVLAKELCHPDQHCVASGVAVGVIDPLEEVEIEDEEGDDRGRMVAPFDHPFGWLRGLLSTKESQCLLEPGFEGSSIEKAGERIEVSQALEFSDTDMCF